MLWKRGSPGRRKGGRVERGMLKEKTSSKPLAGKRRGLISHEFLQPAGV